MKNLLFVLVLLSISSRDIYGQLNKAVIVAKTYNFNLTEKIPSNLINIKTLGQKLMSGATCSLIKYKIKNTEHLVVIPDYVAPGPQLHFINKIMYGNLKTSIHNLKWMVLEVIQ